MAATALLKFTQGVNVGADGQALFGVTGASVVVANSNDLGVASWQIELVYVPPGSAVSTGTVASSDASGTPTHTFTPDLSGPYRFVLKVWNATGRSGTATSTDIRCFGVKEPNGLYRPAPQLWPRPLPPVASGEIGAKPDENNFAGQENGWSGNGSEGLLDTLIQRVDALALSVMPSIGMTAEGLISQNASRQNVAAGQIMIGGTVYFIGVPIHAGQLVSSLEMGVTTVGAGMTVSLGGFHATDGTRLAQSVDQGTSWQSTGQKSIAMITPFSAPYTGLIYASLLGVGGTLPQLGRLSASAVLSVFAAAIGSGVAPFGTQTGQSVLPATATISAGLPITFWVGVR